MKLMFLIGKIPLVPAMIFCIKVVVIMEDRHPLNLDKFHLFVKLFLICHLGDNCIQNFHLRRYIVGYTVGNLVLRRRISGVVKRDFRTFIRRYTSPNENFEYGYPHSNALLTFSLQKDSENVLFVPIRPATLAA